MTTRRARGRQVVAAVGTTLVLAAFGCASTEPAAPARDPGGCDRCDGLGGEEGQGLGPVESFGSDPRFVVRERFDLASAAGGRERLVEQPFSHRSRKWHVFPFASYGPARYRVELAVRDPRMADRAGVWLYGPRLQDGSWGEPRSAAAAGGAAAVEVATTGYGTYAVVVGPATADGFLPRYPASSLLVGWEDEEEGYTEEWAELRAESEERVFLELETGEAYRVHEPITASERAPAGDVADVAEAFIWVEDEAGELRSFVPVAWSRDSFWVPEDGEPGRLVYGVVDYPDEGDFTLADGSGREESFLVVDSIGFDGRQSDDPFTLRVVPLELGGREIAVVPDPSCDEAGSGSCLMPRFLESAEPVPDSAIRSYRSTFIEGDEPSTYDLALACEGTCAPEARPTRYPVYLAHGFNASAESWEPVLELFRSWGPEWDGWVHAGSVPGYEPVASRAEQLRRNLHAFLDLLESEGSGPPPGEPFMRINLIAHSMGGLDSRYLVGHVRYNNERCHELLECTDENGRPEPCCRADLDGRAVPWSERIASVTTLSTPHCGSSFASWSLERLRDRLVDWAFRRLVARMVGLDTDEQRSLLLETFHALSREFCEEVMGPSFPVPAFDRDYDWACATGRDHGCGGVAAEVDPTALPQPDPTRPGSYLLPRCSRLPTVFAWGAESCISGSCGDVLDPMLALPYAIVNGREGANDGVVSLQSTDFGIFMGQQSGDHFRWTSLETTSRVSRFVGRFLGVRQEPLGEWYRYWVGELARAGY